MSVSTDRIIEISTCLSQPSPYYYGEHVADLFPGYLARHSFDRVVLVSTQKLFEQLGRPLVGEMTGHGVTPELVWIDDGETMKSWETLTALCERLVRSGVTRSSIVVALGGGVVGNVVGMAAGLLYRGIRHIEVPTTLMALTDGVLSNKQAINGALGKNQFGLYHAPLFVWADVAYAAMEPVRQTKSAIVEGLKNGLVHDPNWLAQLARHLERGLPWVRDHLKEVAMELVCSKLEILKCDPTEKAYGIVLEYGHTFGHAVEFLLDGRILHGEAVALGMCTAARLSRDLGIADAPLVELHDDLIGRLLGLRTQIPEELSPETVHATMLADNKRRGERLRCLLLKEPGRLYDPAGTFTVEVATDDVLAVLGRVRGRSSTTEAAVCAG